MTLPLSPDLNEIAKLLDRSRPQVVIVVGTGISINATGLPHASWLGLLKHGIRHLVQKRFQPQWGIELDATLDAAFSPFHLHSALQHAQLVEQALNTPDKNSYAQWLESAFAHFKTRNEAKAKAPLEVLRDLHEAGALLLTTNYDSLLSDITGSPPVTWEEHADFHRVMTRQKTGILHIHGHWQRPSSIVLGRSSYDRVVADVNLQQLFRTLWLDWSWIYVGCGDGLDDPNLGRLLEWSKGWGESGLPDFFLAREDRAKEIASRPGKPPNLISIGYPSHDDLSVMLRSATPVARCWPFVLVDDDFSLFHVPGASDPFPTRQEYLDGEVPTLEVDVEILARLQTHGWASCIDVASVGKTTLALRMGTTFEQRAHPVFYLDMKIEIPDDVDASPVAAVHRLARPGTLLILDNIHHQPELARQLWQQWNAKPTDSRGRLLLVATKIHHPVVTTPEQDLMYFEKHSANPAIRLQPSPEDLGRMAKYHYQRAGGSKCPLMPDPPADVLADWHQNYGAALNAFTFAVLDSLADFQKCKWSLPPSRASAWVKYHWLNKIDTQELENLICLAAFGSQELEMLVRNQALPHPGKTEKLSELGLVAPTKVGKLKQFRHFELREPGWGRLILAAMSTKLETQTVILATASRDLITAIILSSRLRRDGHKDQLKYLWAQLVLNADGLVNQIWELSLASFAELVRSANTGGQPQLLIQFWEIIENNPNKFAASAWATPLGDVGSFLNVAKQQGRDTAPFWKLLESQPDKFAANVWATSLENVGSFLNVAMQQGHDTAPFWKVLESQPDKFAANVWATPLEKVGSFLNVAKQQGRDTAPFWKLLESQPDKFAANLWATPLEKIGSFLYVAKQQGRDTAPFWKLLESQPDKFAAKVWARPLRHVGSFLYVAKRQGHDTAPFWKLLESQPDKFAASAWATSLENLGSFLNMTKQQGHDTALFWKLLESQPDKFAASAWATSLEKVGSFLNVAKQQGHDTALFWKLLESQPDKFAASAWATSLEKVGSFLNVAKQQGRDTAPFWRLLESQLDKFAASAWATSLERVGSFLYVAKRQGRDTAPFWKLLESQPDKFAASAWATSLEKVGSFLNVAKQQGRDTAPFWRLLESQLDKFAASAWATSLERVGSFLYVAKRQGRDTAPFWRLLESQLDKFAASAWATSLEKVGSFLYVAKRQGRDTAPFWKLLESQPDKFAANVWATPLEKVGSFLNVAKQQGRDTAPFWKLLESQPDKFAASAWATPLGDVGSFLNVAKQQGHDTAPFWNVLANDPRRLS